MRNVKTDQQAVATVSNRRQRTVILTFAWAAVLASGMVWGQQGSPEGRPPVTPAPPPQEKPAGDAPEGILPLPDYSGDFWSRRYLTGDWGQTRSDLAKKGFTLELDWTQVGQGIVDGGRDEDWAYAGSLDLVMNFDLYRLGLIPGALLKFRAESRYGESVNTESGSLLPVNTDAFFPLTAPADEDILLTITELTYVQFLAPTFGLLIGKIQTFDGDANEFASGRGRSQFMNFNFLVSPVTARTIPYSTLGGGVLWLPTPSITIASSVFNTTDSSTNAGFDDLGDGWTWATEAQFQYRLGTLPGGMNLGGIYAFDNDFAHLGGKLSLVPGQGLQLSRSNDSWAFYWSGWQYLWTPETPKDGSMVLTDGRPDLTGLGIFGRFGFADDRTNPVAWAGSIGLGGRGLIPGRDEDMVGLAYNYTEIQDGSIFDLLNLEGSTQAVELFYNFALTPAAGLTLDVQWIDGAAHGLDDATVIGFRLDIRF